MPVRGKVVLRSAARSDLLESRFWIVFGLPIISGQFFESHPQKRYSREAVFSSSWIFFFRRKELRFRLRSWQVNAGAAAAADANPVVMLIMRLLAAASMADNGIAFTSGASPQDDFGAARRPIGFELVL